MNPESWKEIFQERNLPNPVVLHNHPISYSSHANLASHQIKMQSTGRPWWVNNGWCCAIQNQKSHLTRKSVPQSPFCSTTRKLCRFHYGELLVGFVWGLFVCFLKPTKYFYHCLLRSKKPWLPNLAFFPKSFLPFLCFFLHLHPVGAVKGVK